MVRGSKSDLDGGSIADKIKGGTTINGILTPEDATRKGDGVDVADGANGSGDGDGGLVGKAWGGGFGGAGDSGASGWGGHAGLVTAGLFGAGEGSGGSGAGTFFSGYVGAAPHDLLRAALGSTQVPKLGKTQGFGAVKYKGQKGKLGWADARAASSQYGAHNTIGGNCTGIRCAFHQLATTRAHTMTSRDPACTADNGCPPEYAAANSGSSYDGNPVGTNSPNVITTNGVAPQVDGITTPNVNPPDQTQVDQYQQEAQDLESDAKQCQDDRNSSLQQQDRDEQAKLNDLSQQAQDACGNSGGCGPSDQCQAIISQERTECGKYMHIEYQRCMACPITARQGCGSDPPSAADIQSGRYIDCNN